MRAYARVKPYALDDGRGIQALHLGIGVQFVEITYPERQVCVGKEFHRLGLLHAHEQAGDVLFQGTLPKKHGKGMRRLLQIAGRHVSDGLVVPFVLILGTEHLGEAHDDARGIEIVVQGLALAQEFGREEQAELPVRPTAAGEEFGILRVQAPAIAHGDGRFYHHRCLGIYLQHQIDNVLYVVRVEEVLHGVVVSRCRYHHKVGISISRAAVQSGGKVKFPFRKVLLYIFVLYGGYAAVYLVHLLRYYIHGGHLVVLRQKGGYAKPDVSRAGNGYPQVLKVPHCLRMSLVPCPHYL